VTARAPGARGAVITGTGSFAPARVVTNAELSAALGTDVDPFVRGTLGIAERRWCGDGESTADLAEAAARRALDDAGVAPGDLDLLVVATDTPEYVSPATSSVVQGRLGALRAGTFDVNSGCAGFATALDVAWKYVRADERYGRVLVVGAYAMSKFLDPGDKKTATIFADGAGAVVLEAVEGGAADDPPTACSPPSCTPTGASRRGWACSPAAPPSRSPRPCSATATATGCASSRSTRRR
jgi:3-oxoacyl-[acyl-carrier-protein] synthase-3